jgi:hypothetical protein
MGNTITIRQPINIWCVFLGFDAEALLKELAAGKGDGEILQWC